MTIYCSNLPNDQDMIRALGSCALPLPLDIGDCCFHGVDGSDSPIVIAIERKKSGDLAQCILNGRYISQARTSCELGADVLVLIIEEEQLRANPDDGLLERLVWGINPRTMKRCQVWEPVRPAVTYARWCAYLAELQRFLGVLVFRTANVQETAAVIKSLYAWFQRPDHQSLNTIYKAPLREVLLVKPSLLRRVASELPGIGWEWSKVAEQKFLSVRDMATASVKDWASLQHESNRKERKLGKKVAEKVVEAINKKIVRKGVDKW